jgi:hypothetical protein
MKRSHLTTFNQWLDGLVGGRSTPPHDAPSDPALHHVQSAARQLHDLAWHADQTANSRSLPSTWEDFMQSHHLEPAPRITQSRQVQATAPGESGRGYPNPLNALNSRPARYVSNVIVAAIVVAVLVAGGWRAAQQYNPGQSEEPATIPFGAYLQDEATPESAQAVDLLAPATADQCTIAPLTVDEVVAIVQDPYGNSSGGSEAATTMASATPAALDGLIVASPDIDANAIRPAEFATTRALLGATETFHMFEACIEANSYFQVWATLTPTLVQESILGVLPPLTGEDDLRALLADLEANGPGDPLDPTTVFRALETSPLAGSLMSPIESLAEASRVSRTVDQDLENSWMPEPGFLVTGYTSYWPGDPDLEMPATSIYDADLDGTPEPLVGYDPRLKQPGCFSIIFTWSNQREMWLIQHYPVCG